MQDLWGASPLRLARYDAFMSPPMLIERAWAMLNVKYVITWRSELYAPSTVIHQEPAGDDTTYVHRLNEVGPRAWLVHRFEQMPEAEMIARMAEPDFDFRQVALVSEAGANTRMPTGRPVDEYAHRQQEEVRVVSAQPNRIVLDVEAASEGMLVLSEIDYPGWRVTVDGAPVSMVRANYVLRAAPVPAGTHQIIFEFSPLTFKLGAVISGLALLGLILVLLFRR
jgi:hypothetical protein